MLATMYYGHVASLMAEMADAIGKPERAMHFQNLAKKLKQPSQHIISMKKT